MENKINIAELLKDCPSGMELDCTMFDDVTFEGIKQDEYPIVVKIKEPSMTLSLTKTGGWNLYNSAKCVIFPKDKTTWEGFVPPCKFKVGDRVRHKNNHNVVFTITSIEEDYYACGVATAFWFDDQDDYELVPNKFDITTLKPFDKVLVRDTNGQVWTADLFSHIIDTNPNLRTTFVCIGHYPKQCVPYEENKHLLGTTDDCNEFYKTWEI